MLSTGRTVMLPVPRYRDLMVPTLSGEHEHHARRGAEVRFRDAAVDEADGAVKLQRVRIGGDLQALRAPRPQDLGDAADERGGNTAAQVESARGSDLADPRICMRR